MAADKLHVDDGTKKKTTNLPNDKQFLDTFWKLAVPSDNERINGAKSFLQILISKQNDAKEVGINVIITSYTVHGRAYSAGPRPGRRPGKA